MINKGSKQRRARIKAYVRKKISGTAERPRLTVYRSLGHIYGQVIDDVAGRTLVAVSSVSKDLKPELANAKSKKDKSILVGKAIAKKALEKNIHNVVFDRNGYLYHGRVKALADGARQGGLKF